MSSKGLIRCKTPIGWSATDSQHFERDASPFPPRPEGASGRVRAGWCWRFPPACPAGSGGPRQGNELDRRKYLGECRLGKFVSATPRTPPARRETKAAPDPVVAW